MLTRMPEEAEMFVIFNSYCSTIENPDFLPAHGFFAVNAAHFLFADTVRRERIRLLAFIGMGGQ